MQVIARPKLNQWIEDHPNAREALLVFYAVAVSARWTELDDVRATFPSADVVRLPNGRMRLVFNIKGNSYRLVAGYQWASETNAGRLYLKDFMTHAEYDKDRWKR